MMNTSRSTFRDLRETGSAAGDHPAVPVSIDVTPEFFNYHYPAVKSSIIGGNVGRFMME